MKAKASDKTKTKDRSASIDLVRTCRLIALALKELERNRKGKFAVDILHHLGICLARLKLDEEAIEVLKIVLTFEPDHVEAHRQTGLLYFLSDQNEKAVEAYNAVLRLRPDDVDAYSSLGDCYLNLLLYDKAIENYKKAIQLSPKDAGLHSSLASALYMKMQKIGPAIKKYQEFAGGDKISRETILRNIEVMCGTEEIPGTMETIREDGLRDDYGKIQSSTIS